MKKVLHIIAFTLATVLVACGGGNSVDNLKNQLDDIEQGSGPSFSQSASSTQDINEWVLKVINDIASGNMALIESGPNPFNSEDINFNYTNNNASAQGSLGGVISGSVTASGSGNENSVVANADTDSTLTNYSEQNGLTLTGTSQLLMDISATPDSGTLAFQLTALVSSSGDVGAKVAVDISISSDLAQLFEENKSADAVKASGTVVVVSGDKTYTCSVSADVNSADGFVVDCQEE